MSNIDTRMAPQRAAYIGKRVLLTDGRRGTIRTCTWDYEGFVEFDRPDGGSTWANLRTDIAEWLADADTLIGIRS